jgi:RNA polymerase sigma-70 factor (ECF subfamily)
MRALFEEHHRALLAYCVLACRGDRDAALDLLQDTFERAFAGYGRLQDKERFRGWLFTIAANLARARGVRDDRRRQLLGRLELCEEAPLPGEPVEREARIAQVQRLLSAIGDESLRAIVQLKYGEPEHTTRQIAERLSLPHGTVTNRLLRFRAALRRDLCRALAEEEVA